MFKHRKKTESLDFQSITAKDIAESNGIDYIPEAKGPNFASRRDYCNKYMVVKGKYILLHPANDGMPTCPIRWYYWNKNFQKSLILDNQSSFKCITNLGDILLEMVRLYKKYIEEDVFIASAGFAVRLDDKITQDYHGKASLVLTDDSIRNNKVKSYEKNDAKKYFLNDFLDHYIGWNFGVAVENNPELKKELITFNDLVISKGLREYAGTGFDVWQNNDVQPYRLKTE